jgi:hypothetical protein
MRWIWSSLGNIILGDTAALLSRSEPGTSHNIFFFSFFTP